MQVHIAGSQKGAGSVSLSRADLMANARTEPGGRVAAIGSFSVNDQPGANSMNRQVDIRQFMVVLAVAIVLGLVISFVLGGVPAP
jgi:hypothetical protein